MNNTGRGFTKKLLKFLIKTCIILLKFNWSLLKFKCQYEDIKDTIYKTVVWRLHFVLYTRFDV